MKTIQMPYPELAKALGVENIYLKREDTHKYGSHKGRSIPLMIKNYNKQGINTFVISSSGNAALAAVLAVENRLKNNPEVTLSLKIFVGKNIDQKKLEKLKRTITCSDAITIEQVDNPKQKAFQLDKAGEAKFLRQSTDDLALDGYMELAQEITKIPELSAIFIPTSSGTTAQAIGQYILDRNLPIQLHIAQTTSCHPIAEEFDTKTSDEPSLAGAIVDKVAHRKEVLIPIIKKTNGFGWIIDNTQIQEAQKLVKTTTDLDISATSALSVAALQKALKMGKTFDGPVSCFICGA